MKERSCTSLSRSMKHGNSYSKYDDGGYSESSHRRKEQRSKKDYSDSDSDSSRSRSSSSHDSESKDDIRKVKEEFRKRKYDGSRSEKFENTSRSHTYGSVRIKEEQISDDEHNFRNARRFKNESMYNVKNEKPKRSRWNDDSPPASSKRLRDTDKEPRWGKPGEEGTAGIKKKPVVNIAKPDFGLSGKLAEETNMYNGVVIKYSEPPEARKPKWRWRLYPFKGDEGLQTLYIHRQSAYLIGRDRKVADIPIDHPSCSKQHAALQYRLVPFEKSDGRSGKRICPYIIDLESANGTFVNNAKIESKKYVQLIEKDVIKFAFSSREYVLLHEHSKDSDDDDNM